MKYLSILLVLFLLSCQSEIKDGVIVSKYVVAPHTESYMYTTVMLVGKIPISTTHIAKRYIKDTAYSIRVIKLVDGEKAERVLNLSKSNYENLRIGQYVIIGK